MPWLEGRTGITLAPSQREALHLAAASKALLITGGLGVGGPILADPMLKMPLAKSVAAALCTPDRPCGEAPDRVDRCRGRDDPLPAGA